MNALDAPIKDMTRGQLEAAVSILRVRNDALRQGLIKLCNTPNILLDTLRDKARELLRETQ